MAHNVVNTKQMYVVTTRLYRGVSVNVSVQMEGYPGTWKPGSHMALRGEVFPVKGHPETRGQEAHNSERKSPQQQGGYPQLSSGAQRPQSARSCFSPFLYCLSSSDERITPGSKSHGRDLLEGLECGRIKPGVAALCFRG